VTSIDGFSLPKVLPWARTSSGRSFVGASVPRKIRHSSSSSAGVFFGSAVLICLSLSSFKPELANAQELDFNIPAQRTDNALLELAEHSKYQIIFTDGLTERCRSSLLQGPLTVEAALDELLNGTGLSYEIVSNRTIVVRKARAQPPIARRATTRCEFEQESNTSGQSLFSKAMGALAAIFGSGSANAQGTSVSIGKSVPGRILEEVIVSARKRNESIRDVPVTITEYGHELLSEYQINSFDELAQFVPGLISTDGSAGPSGGAIYLRGIGNGDANPLNSHSVAIVVDSMPVGSLNIRRVSQFDLAQIEVLRGPQALFFGKNTPGGLISMTTTDPGEELEIIGSVGYEFESDDQYLEFIASGPISDNVGLRLAVRYTELNGYFDLKSVPSEGNPLIVPGDVSGYPDGDETFLRGTLTADPSDRLSIRAKLTYNEQEIAGGSVTPYQRFSCPLGSPQGPFGSSGQAAFPCQDNNRDIYLGSVPEELWTLARNSAVSSGIGTREQDLLLGTLEFNYELTPELEFTSITGYLDAEEVMAQNASGGPQVTLFIPHSSFEIEQYTQEFRLTSQRNSSVNFMLGLFAEHKEIGTDANAVFAPGIIAPAAVVLPDERPEEESDTYSAFVQVQWDITDQIELSGGVRYTKEEKSLDYFASFGGGDVDVSSNLAVDELDSSNVSPEVTLMYHPVEKLMLYASYKTGYKSDGFDGGYTQGAILVPGYENTYDEEEVSGFELGSKAVVADGSLALNLSLYSYQYDDLQVGELDAETLQFRVTNAAEATIRGVELDFDWASPIKGLTFRGSASYNDAEYDDYLAGCYVGQTPGLGCNVTPDPVTGVFLEQDLSAARLNQAPEWSGILGLNYESPLGDRLEMGFALNAVYSDEFIGNGKQAPADVLDSHTKFHANLRLSTVDQRWEVLLIARNLTDEITYTATNATTLTGAGSGFEGAILSDRTGLPTKGRELHLRLTYRFNNSRFMN
jgi:iron complex outermembrane receptor protein